MASNVVRMAPSAMPPQPSQQDWVWDGANWVWCGPPMPPSPPSCPPPGFPTPCPPWFPPPAGQAPWYPGANGGVSFSATPPVNPIRGNFWWDGTMLHLFDGAVWVNIGPGASGVPGGMVGGITLAIAQLTNIALGTTNWAPLLFTGTPMVDTQGAWAPGTGRYMPNKAGVYLVELRGITHAGESAGLVILKNDTGAFTITSADNIIAATGIGGPTAPSNWMSCTGVANMNGTTDYVRAWAYDTSSTFNVTGPSPCFGAVKIG